MQAGPLRDSEPVPAAVCSVKTEAVSDCRSLPLQHALSGHAKVKPFDPKVACKQECLITTFQDVYFVSESFEDAKEKMR